MLDSKESKRRSAANEEAVKEQFEKLRYIVRRLDTESSKRKRPDFLASSTAGRPQLLCEVKTVDSGGFPRDKSVHGVEYVHISTLDDKLRDFRNIPIDRSKIDNGLASAVNKRAVLVADDPSLKDVPLPVAFFFDQLADYLFSYPRTFGQHLQIAGEELPFREVSGILTIEEDVARKKAFAELSDEQQKRHVEARSTNDDLPPRSKDFVLVKNDAALRVIPNDFERLCLPDCYYP